MSILLGLEFVLVIGAAIIAIMSAIRPAPILWIAVILLCIAEALNHAGSVLR
jgi:hypothetical protein